MAVMKKEPFAIYNKEGLKNEEAISQLTTTLLSDNDLLKGEATLMWALRDIAELTLLNSDKAEYIDYTLVERFCVEMKAGQECKVYMKMVIPPEDGKQPTIPSRDYLQIRFTLYVEHDETTGKQYYTWNGHSVVYRSEFKSLVIMTNDTRNKSDHGANEKVADGLLKGENENGSTAEQEQA